MAGRHLATSRFRTAWTRGVLTGSPPISVPPEIRGLKIMAQRRRNRTGVACLHPGERRCRRFVTSNPSAGIHCVNEQDAAHLLDRVWVRLRRVSGADDIFGIDAFEMRARILDDTIIAAFDRPVTGNRDDRGRVDTRGT